MYKAPYNILPSSQDFFGNKLHGTGKWTLHKVSHPFDSFDIDVEKAFPLYNFYSYVGKAVKTEQDVLKELNVLNRPNEYTPAKYVRKVYSEPYPTQNIIEEILSEEAKNEVRFSLFGNIEKKRQLYVIERLPERLRIEGKKWREAKQAFDDAENEKALLFESKEAEKQSAVQKDIEEYNNRYEQNDTFLNADQEQIESLLQTVDPHFLYDFSMIYQIDLPHNLVNISFEVPSERIVPIEKSIVHSRGTSLKPKTKTEINKDYLDCVCGLGYVVAAQCFNKTAKIDTVYLSAFVKKLNPQTATFEEETIYAIVFDRNTFNWVIKPKSFLPYESLVFFPHAIELGVRMSMLPIDPLNLTRTGEPLPGGNQFVDASRFDGRFSDTNYRTFPFEKRPFDPHSLDPLFEEAARIVVLTQTGKSTIIQRKLNLGYSRAERLMSQLEATGIVGSNYGSGGREVLVKDFDKLDEITARLSE